MPTKRAVLAELTPAELRDNLDRYGLAVDDRRVKAHLVDALARSRKARLDEMLLRLSRNRLKELCRVFGLDDSGRKKADLVARLVGPAAASSGPESPNVASGDDDGIAPPADSRPAAEAPEPPADVLSVAICTRGNFRFPHSRSSTKLLIQFRASTPESHRRRRRRLRLLS